MFTRATGIGAAVAVLATVGLATAAVAHSRTSAGGEWEATAPVQYQHQSWGDPKTKVEIAIWAPKDWKRVKLSALEVKFTSPDGLRNLRVDAAANNQPLKAAEDDKFKLTSASSKNFELVSRTTGTTRATNPNFQGMVFHHSTLTYTYTDRTRGSRLVVDRFVSLNDTTHTLFEISTGGRPQDAAALNAITTKATEDFSRLP